MKVSEITAEEVISFCRIDDPDEEDIRSITQAMGIVKSYMSAYTGLTADEIDDHEDMCWAFYILCRDNYDNRSLSENSSFKMNRTVSIILDMHSVNMLG